MFPNNKSLFIPLDRTLDMNTANSTPQTIAPQIAKKPLFVPLQNNVTPFQEVGNLASNAWSGIKNTFSKENINRSIADLGQSMGVPAMGQSYKPTTRQTADMILNLAAGGAPRGALASGLSPKVLSTIVKTEPKVFQGLKNTSTKLLESFKGMPEEITQQQFNEVLNRTKKMGLKQADEQIMKDSFVIENGKINLPKTAAKVETQLVPLTPTPVKSPRWSYIGQEFIGDGKYGEIVYQSPIKTSAGDIHFRDQSQSVHNQWKGNGQDVFPNYFSHVRYEDLTDGKTRKILETQSDLMQKENFASEVDNIKKGSLDKNNILRKESELKPLEAYSSNDPLAQLRTFREEVKRAAKDGKDTLLIPSGDTAMKIEGLGQQEGIWNIVKQDSYGGLDLTEKLTPEKLKTGLEVNVMGRGDLGQDNWIITDVLGDGKFKAIPRTDFEKNITGEGILEKMRNPSIANYTETFDISDKADIKHFVYKLNEEAIPREARKMGLEVEKVRITNNDNIVPLGTKTIESNKPGEWWRIKIPKEMSKKPVIAFGIVLPLLIPLSQNKSRTTQKQEKNKVITNQIKLK